MEFWQPGAPVLATPLLSGLTGCSQLSHTPVNPAREEPHLPEGLIGKKWSQGIVPWGLGLTTPRSLWLQSLPGGKPGNHHIRPPQVHTPVQHQCRLIWDCSLQAAPPTGPCLLSPTGCDLGGHRAPGFPPASTPHTHICRLEAFVVPATTSPTASSSHSSCRQVQTFPSPPSLPPPPTQDRAWDPPQRVSLRPKGAQAKP